MNKYYLRIEGVNLNNFVYDTQNLSTIRGSGLAILESVSFLENREILGHKLEKISTGASAGLFEFIVSDEAGFDREEFCRAVKSALTEHQSVFRYATFVIDVLPASGGFQIDREKILAKNRWRQMGSPRLAIPEYDAYNIRKASEKSACELDFVRPARNPVEIKGKSHSIGDSAYYRRRYGTEKKQRFVKNELAEYNRTIGEPGRAFELSSLENHKFVRDLNGLTTNPEKPQNIQGKMAVIYLDGNDFGKKQRDLDRDNLEKFDDEKTYFQRRWLAALMTDVAAPACQDWIFNDEFQLEILLWGGDEICLVVPAWQGWKVVEQFYRHSFEWNKETLTHSLGVVFCHHRAPIRRIKNLAAKLADLAKEMPGKHNYFAYEILESFDHISKDLKKHRLSRSPQIAPPDPKKLILNGDRMPEITERLRNVKSFLPRRKLTQIVLNLLTPVENEEERINRAETVGELIESVKKSAGENSGVLQSYLDLFEDEYTGWIHARELWDYIGEAA